ncbi:MAG: hypothetical protein ACOYM9_14730, partial [Bradymonadia bacterium]
MRVRGTEALWVWGALLGAACGETSATAERDELTDTGVRAPDAPVADAGDGPVGGGETPEDLGRPRDAALPADASVTPDAALPPHLTAPLARIYLHDPITDDDMLTEVTLPETSTPDGRLTDDSVAVFNCLKEAGGVSAMPFGNFVVSLCREVQQARPAEDGHYLHIEPPRRESDGNDSFAELMMYANV